VVQRCWPRSSGASPDEVSITSNTTEGYNFVVGGLDLQEGDEVLISNLEHPGAMGPWNLKEKRFKVKIRQVQVGPPHKGTEDIVKALAAAVTPRTKLIALGHTVFITGLISPIKEISAMAHGKGIPVLATAHGRDANLNLRDMVDFRLQPLLAGRDGGSVLYARKESQTRFADRRVSGWENATGPGSSIRPG
jgi:selenocysteine lyase/cysteine desulfurase